MVDKQDHNLRQFQWAALGLVLLTIATRLPSLLHPQPIDSESMYSVVANEIVDGGRPYLDAVERKPPLLFWTYAAVFELAGKYNWKVLHVVALVWTLATMAGLYLVGTRLFDRNTGLIAALFYSVFQPCGRAPKYSLRRRTVDESSYRVGMGDRLPAELVTSSARTSSCRARF